MGQKEIDTLIEAARETGKTLTTLMGHCQQLLREMPYKNCYCYKANPCTLHGAIYNMVQRNLKAN